MALWIAASLMGGDSHAGAPELHLAVLGRIPEGKSIETMAARFAVDHHNRHADPALGRVRLLGFHSKGSPEGALEAARRICADPAARGVLVFGEEGADAAVLDQLAGCGLATVMASSWAAPRPASNTATWLCPSHLQLAETAAAYARKGKKASQVAVIDNGAPTSVAAARAFARRFKELGGRVDFEGEWQGTAWGLTRTVKALQANWPQVVFFPGEGVEAGHLAKAMRKVRELKGANLLGLPTLFDPGFFDAGRVATKMSSVVFPAPDYRGVAQLNKAIGMAFPRSSPHYKAYVSYAYRRPGRWTSMVFDGAKLLVDAIEAAAKAHGGDPGRQQLRDALDSISSYRGIRGMVKFSANREPVEPTAMIFYALPKVNSREMKWYDKEFGPPF